MAPFIQTLALILDVAFTLLLVHVIMSWLINFQVLNLGQPLVAQIWQGLNRLFEPVFRPVRNILPNTHPLDLAPLAGLYPDHRPARLFPALTLLTPPCQPCAAVGHRGKEQQEIQVDGFGKCASKVRFRL